MPRQKKNQKKIPAPPESPGRGRPALPPEARRSVELRVRVTAEEHAAILAAGGSEWVRDVLLRELAQRG